RKGTSRRSARPPHVESCPIVVTFCGAQASHYRRVAFRYAMGQSSLRAAACRSRRRRRSGGGRCGSCADVCGAIYRSAALQHNGCRCQRERLRRGCAHQQRKLCLRHHFLCTVDDRSSAPLLRILGLQLLAWGALDAWPACWRRCVVLDADADDAAQRARRIRFSRSVYGSRDHWPVHTVGHLRNCARSYSRSSGSVAATLASGATRVTALNPSEGEGGISLRANPRIAFSGTMRSRNRFRAMHTSTGTSKKTASTSQSYSWPSRM